MILPKQDKEGRYYTSYSQLSSFMKNKKEFYKSYFFNEDIQFRDYLDFGSKVGEALEKHDFTDFSEEEQETLRKVERLDEFEKEIRVDFENFYVKGFIDSNTTCCTRMLDYKTGSNDKRKEYEKEDYIQPEIYALGLLRETGKLPEQVEVHLIERTGNPMKGEPLKVGKDIQVINRPITEERLTKVKEMIVKTVYDISNHYNVFLKLNQ